MNINKAERTKFIIKCDRKPIISILPQTVLSNISLRDNCDNFVIYWLYMWIDTKRIRYHNKVIFKNFQLLRNKNQWNDIERFAKI